MGSPKGSFTIPSKPLAQDPASQSSGIQLSVSSTTSNPPTNISSSTANVSTLTARLSGPTSPNVQSALIHIQSSNTALLSTAVETQKSWIADAKLTSALLPARTQDKPSATALDSSQAQRQHIAIPAPGDDLPLDDTVQLFLCASLLDKNRSGSRPLPTPLSSVNLTFTRNGNDQDGWVRFTEHYPLEKEHLCRLMNRMANKFVLEPTRDPDSIREVVLIGPLLDKDHHRELVRVFLQEFQRGALLDANILLGLVQLARDCPNDSLVSDDLIRILRCVGRRLEETPRTDTEENTIYLTHAATDLLTSLVSSLPKDHSHIELEQLFMTLSYLRKHKNTIIKFQARYARQILVLVSDRNMKTDDPSLTQGTRRISKLLKRSLRSHGPKQWFQDVQKAKGFAQNRLYSELNKLIYEGPSIASTDFQWHMCRLLGEIAVNLTQDNDIRRQALTLLYEYATVNGAVTSGHLLRRWALTILRYISGLAVTFATPTGPFNPQAIYNKVIMENTSSLVCGLGGRGVKLFESTCPLTISLPPPATSPLLVKVNKDPDVEFAIDRLLRQRSRVYDKRAVYIQLLSKKNLRASEDILVELQDRARTFLESKNEVLLILGDSGAGKSTFGLRLENELWIQYRPGGPIPLFIDLKTIDTPDRDMIRQHLDDLGLFTDQQIESMQQSRRFILVCDGYDECHKWTNLHTGNRFNKPRQWQSKMIISCRTQYLGPNYRNYFEPESSTIGSPNFSNTSDLFEEAVIVPFRSTQIEEYVELFTQLPKTEGYLVQDPGWSTEQYMGRLRSITHLMELAKNPFMLKMILDILPTIAATTTKMTRVDLYDRFVELHFESEYRRLANQHSSGKMDDRTLSVFTSLKVDDLIDLGLDFSKQLSHRIFKDLNGINSVTYSAAQDSGSWKDRFFGSDEQAKLLRQSAQLVCRENRNQDSPQLIRLRSRLSRKRNSYEFIHRSMLEYFYSCLIFDPRGNTPQLDLATCLDSADSPLPVIEHPLGQTSIVSESSIVDFLAERVHQSESFGSQLQNIIQLSKAEIAIGRAASNAITILVGAGERFNSADLRRIKVPGADLSYGDFDSAQLQGANLANTILQNVWLRQADLSNSQMEGVEFGQLPYLQQNVSVLSCAFSPDGKKLSVGLINGAIAMYDTSTWSGISLYGHRGTVKTFLTDERGYITKSYSTGVTSVVYSPSGQQIASGSMDGTVRLWDVHTCSLVFTLRGHVEDVMSVAFSPNGQQIASGGEDRTVRLWDAQTGTLCSTLAGHIDIVRSVAYSPNGRQIASCGEDNAVRLWDVWTGALCSTLSEHSDWVLSVTYSPNGQQIASGSKDNTVRLWDALTGALSSTLSGHAYFVTSVAYSPNGQLIASGSMDETVRLWDVVTGTLTSTFSGHIDGVTSLAYSPNSQQIASGSYGMTVRLWDTQTGALGNTFSGHTRDVMSVSYSPGGQQIASGSQDNTLRLWDAQSGHLDSTLSGHSGIVYSVVYSPSGRQIASGGQDKTLRLWDAQSGTHSSTLSGHTSDVFSVAYSPNGQQIVSGSKDKTVRLWDVQTGILVSTLSGHTGVVYSVVYSPSGQQIASGSKDKTLRLWDVLTGALITTLSGHAHYVTSVVYSPSGQQIASASYDRTVRLWDAQTGAHSSTLRGHTAFVASIVYSPCGQRIASGSYDKTLRLWDQDSGQCLFILGGFQDGVTSIAWKTTLDDTYFAVGGWDKSVRLWKVVEEDGKDIQFRLQWRSAPDTLVLSKASIDGVQGLSQMNQLLFQQQQATGWPATP